MVTKSECLSSNLTFFEFINMVTKSECLSSNLTFFELSIWSLNQDL